MCAEGREAMNQRQEATAKLLEACSARCRIRERLKLVYPVEPVPYDLTALAMRIGGQR